MRVARVGGEEHRAPLGVELVVDREVRQVEERIAHARVLPVDDHEPLAVVDEVRVEQVVVARTRRLAGAQLGDPPRQLVRRGERVGNDGSSLDGRVPIRLDDLEPVEPSGYRRPLVEGTERPRDATELLGLAKPLRRRDRSVDEARDEPSLGLDEVDDLRSDAHLCRGAGRRQLHRPVDPEQVGVLPGDAQHDDARRGA